MKTEDELLELLIHFQNGLSKYRDHLIKHPKLNKLTVNQIQYLEAINLLKSSMISEVAKTLDVSKASATVAINKLITLGFVRKYNSTEDKRVHYVQLTPKGMEIVNSKNIILKKSMEDIMIKLDSDEIETFVNILKKINRDVE